MLTFPFNDNSPVIDQVAGILFPSVKERKAVQNEIPADGPSFGEDPFMKWICTFLSFIFSICSLLKNRYALIFAIMRLSFVTVFRFPVQLNSPFFSPLVLSKMHSTFKTFPTWWETLKMLTIPGKNDFWERASKWESLVGGPRKRRRREKVSEESELKWRREAKDWKSDWREEAKIKLIRIFLFVTFVASLDFEFLFLRFDIFL